jgi:hypothetical protein
VYGLNCSAFRAFGSGVLGANMGGELVVALLLKVLHHFTKRFAAGRISSIEHPSAFRTTPTIKAVFFDPYELASRGHLQYEDEMLGQDVSCHSLLLLVRVAEFRAGSHSDAWGTPVPECLNSPRG